MTTSRRPRTREHIRLVERLVALAETYGAEDVADLETDIEQLVRVEYLVLERRVRTAEERARWWRVKLDAVSSESGQNSPSGK